MSRNELYLTVYGQPAPQGSKRHVGGGRMVEVSKKVKPWRSAVKAAVQMAFQETEDATMFTGPVEIHVVYFLDRPASVTKKKRPLPIVPPDLDKLDRGLFDAMTEASVWADDSLVIVSRSQKLYADTNGPGAQIAIKAITATV